jgi:hypothetical protein
VYRRGDEKGRIEDKRNKLGYIVFFSSIPCIPKDNDYRYRVAKQILSTHEHATKGKGET